MGASRDDEPGSDSCVYREPGSKGTNRGGERVIVAREDARPPIYSSNNIINIASLTRGDARPPN